MAPTKYIDRTIPRISLANFNSRIDTITEELVRAAETDGFFSLKDTGISVGEIEAMFVQSAGFFALPDEEKATVPWLAKNVGWEKNSQIRPSTGTADMKESYQLQFGENMKDSWISSKALPDFRETALEFMRRTQAISEKLMLCFARGLGFSDDYFIKAHDVSRPDSQTTLRLLHYFEVDKKTPVPEGYFRAGAHADWDFLTLLFQQPGQSGLEICPGREAVTSFGIGDVWTKVDFEAGDIVCNIGDLLMSWSDDRFKSTFHRVRAPMDPQTDYYGPRYSIAFFNQPCSSCTIQGPLKKYPAVTGEEFTRSAMNRNFAALKAKKDAMGVENEDDGHGAVSQRLGNPETRRVRVGV
ncbi:iron/ascorbate family oxidoreductase [Lepidopterella palustris CBS 459.81]|uniref:Iron/ascorbate family oxidoreductase n=1 Tax=Lepidopterella palustris CBS 459.81 TaxID=1314670 RepID=A0A8E2E1N8_9PEZI|nr:iron/ascorbate family oxidoreductase [Lepidopterella palustris CBS 459.81]